MYLKTLNAYNSKLLFCDLVTFSSKPFNLLFGLFTTDLNCRKKLACDIISECYVILAES